MQLLMLFPSLKHFPYFSAYLDVLFQRPSLHRESQSVNSQVSISNHNDKMSNTLISITDYSALQPYPFSSIPASAGESGKPGSQPSSKRRLLVLALTFDSAQKSWIMKYRIPRTSLGVTPGMRISSAKSDESIGVTGLVVPRHSLENDLAVSLNLKKIIWT